ncbi:MAG: energy-coupling factor transporter transmembrane protein EcfT [Clostridium sp.]|nr:energy-coupling factor transporter transmembrane protein EcfT [Clostridium sp.]
MSREKKFAAYNPIVSFMYFAGAIIISMLAIHPVAALLSLVMAAICYINAHGREAWKVIGAMLPIYVLLALANPVFNTRGETILFTYFGGRVFTLEALYYGIVLAAMFISVILWFFFYHKVMTADKLLYIFGGLVPAVGLALSMILRLLPYYRTHMKSISSARKAVSCDGENRTVEAANVMLAMLSWSLEEGIVTADSMKCRGHGCGKRSRFSVYSLKAGDVLFMLWIIILILCIMFCKAKKGLEAVFLPCINISGMDNDYFVMGLAAMVLYFATPIVINVTEAVKWHYLKSRI